MDPSRQGADGTFQTDEDRFSVCASADGLDAELRALIRRMDAKIPLLGAPRIRGELLTLGVEIAQSSVAKYTVNVWRPTIWVPEEQAALPQSAFPSSRRGGRSRSTHSASLAGYPGGQVINSGEECPQDRGRVRLMISDDQIDGRRRAFQRTADDRPLQEILCGGRQQSYTAGRRNQRNGHCEIIDLKMRHDLYFALFQIIVDNGAQHARHA
jgi:hypothetical protein